jgi:hypothetical protein
MREQGQGSRQEADNQERNGPELIFHRIPPLLHASVLVSREMDKEKMDDMSGHREVDRAGSNSESFCHTPSVTPSKLCRLG